MSRSTSRPSRPSGLVAKARRRRPRCRPRRRSVAVLSQSRLSNHVDMQIVGDFQRPFNKFNYLLLEYTLNYFRDCVHILEMGLKCAGLQRSRSGFFSNGVT